MYFSVAYSSVRETVSTRTTLATVDDDGPTQTLDFYGSIRQNVSFAPRPLAYSSWVIWYLFMAIAHTYLFIKAEPVSSSGLYIAIWIVFFVHLFFNAIWSTLFFGMQSRRCVGLALGDIILVFLLAITQIVLYAVYCSPVVTYVLWSLYLLWLLFATILSIAIFMVRDRLAYPFSNIKQN